MTRKADVVIIGGGLAGSATAVMLGRSDLDVVFVDPHPVYRPDFRCEKLDPSQVELLTRMGLAGLILPASTRSANLWVARMGRLVDQLPIVQYGIAYQDLVNAVRAGIPRRVTFIEDTVAAIEPGEDRQRVTLADGETLETRLVVLANGLNWSLRRSLGIECETLSPAHSTSFGFDMMPLDRSSFAFDSLTYYGEHPQDRICYLTLFKSGRTMRANLMTYWGSDDARLQAFRADPAATLAALMPGLAPLLGRFGVGGPLRLRPADLYQATHLDLPGVVLVGDAYATSCPAAGTGTNKVFMDVDRLCSTYLPIWMQSPGMAKEKVAAFYADPEKVETDTASRRRAFELKAISIERGLSWDVRRQAQYWGRYWKGVVRRLRSRSGSPFSLGEVHLPEDAAHIHE